MNPKVSITMPVLNGEKYIGEALESIRAQTYRNYELILVDDGSTDATRERVEAFRDKMVIHYVRHAQTQGIARSVNDGLAHSSGELIAFLDHDDRWLPEFLETQVRHMESHPDVAMAHSDFQLTDTRGEVVCESVAAWRGRTPPSGHVFRQLFLDSFIVANSVLIRKSCLDRVGGFDEELRFGDYHLWLRIAKQYKLDYVPKPLTQYRQHPSQNTRAVDIANLTKDSAIQSIEKILALYPELRVELGETVIRHRLASLYFGLSYANFSAGAPAAARVCLAHAIRLWPSNVRYQGLYAMCLLPRGLATLVRSVWRRARRASHIAMRYGKGNGAAERPAASELW